MDWRLSIWISTLILITGVNTAEYCSTQTFAPTCNATQVILIQSAQMGRMFAGECIPGDFGSLDCSKDLLLNMDVSCSGRTQCNVPVVELQLDHPDVCPRGVSVFLDADFTCLDVEIFPECSNTSSPAVISKPSAFLASASVQQTNVGTPTCPWIIRASPGQTIEIRFFDFTLYQTVSQVRQMMGERFQCPFWVSISESDEEESLRIYLCDTSLRERELFASTTEKITVAINLNHSLPTEDPPYYLFYFKIKGCPNIQPPEGATIEYYGNGATVLCNATGEQWFLVCLDREWEGPVENCTEDTGPSGPTDPGSQQERKFPFGDNDVIGILVAVSIGIAIGVFVGFALLGLVVAGRRCARMRNNTKKKKKKPNPHDLSQIEIPQHVGKLPDVPAKEGKYTRTPSSASSEEGIYQVPVTPPQQIYDTRVSPYPAYQTAMQTQPVAGPSANYEGGQRSMSDGSSDVHSVATTSAMSGSQARRAGSLRHRPDMDVHHEYETTTNFNRSFGKGSFRKSIDTDLYDTSAALRPAGQKIYDGVENLRY